ncbi:DNA-3-methyladenine glycosylase II [Trichoderma gamsii]|uniref:DNA-3-methyladenine glycosylase II n=1 Tax=Trichoderma gamsii TaxID=398673 RepID=A0A2P4ZVI8_9HYPO|nr:DNA-3-methyladenine glycosylase II [Trichoderma gamsii]PON28309.1 DNA-3-methyladenine glycosylase II [Trichoderma gamsii]
MAATRRSARISAQEAAENTKPAAVAPAPPPPKENKRKRKAVPNPEPTEPKTPTKKQRPVAPPLTPTTSAVGLDGEDKGAAHKAVTRLADPRFSNATLLSPQTSRIVASRNAEPESPSKAASIGGKTTTTTTATLLREACDHLIKVDERMRPLIEKHYCHVFSPEGLAEKIDPFESLVSSIISQQVSGAAARSIKAKFIALFFPEDEDSQPANYEAAVTRFPAPSDVAACSIEKLRTAGLSQRKAEYVQGLAEKFASGEITAQMLHDAPDEELMEKLVAVRGLGKWTVEMFALFALKRMNVFSLGDLGIQRGMAAFVGRDVAKLKNKGGKWKYMSEQDMVELSDKFKPYRSLFMWYMWKVEEVDVSTMG